MIKPILAQFLEDIFLFEFTQEITENTDLFKSGIIDSFGYIKLIKRIEEKFNVEFTESELMNVEVSLNKIAKKVEQKIAETTV